MARRTRREASGAKAITSCAPEAEHHFVGTARYSGEPMVIVLSWLYHDGCFIMVRREVTQ
jgi:hypothetical protein